MCQSRMVPFIEKLHLGNTESDFMKQNGQYSRQNDLISFEPYSIKTSFTQVTELLAIEASILKKYHFKAELNPKAVTLD